MNPQELRNELDAAEFKWLWAYRNGLKQDVIDQLWQRYIDYLKRWQESKERGNNG
jgi:hypothetical protein